MHEVVARRKNNALLLGVVDAGARPTMTGIFALSYLDKNTGAIGRPHDQIYFSATTSLRPIIAF